jgi:hypothetical protein
MTTTMVAGGDHELIRNTYPVDYGGQHFYRADIKANYFGKVSYMTFLANEYGGFLFDWMFEANSEERMNQIINSLNSLSFADRRHN